VHLPRADHERPARHLALPQELLAAAKLHLPGYG
jgi:hypothetical protein